MIITTAEGWRQARKEVKERQIQLAGIAKAGIYDRQERPSETAEAILREMGRENGIRAVVELINLVDPYDNRIAPGIRKWARENRQAYTAEDLEEMGAWRWDTLHPAHIDQIACAVRRIETSGAGEMIHFEILLEPEMVRKADLKLDETVWAEA